MIAARADPANHHPGLWSIAGSESTGAISKIHALPIDQITRPATHTQQTMATPGSNAGVVVVGG